MATIAYSGDPAQLGRQVGLRVPPNYLQEEATRKKKWGVRQRRNDRHEFVEEAYDYRRRATSLAWCACAFCLSGIGTAAAFFTQSWFGGVLAVMLATLLDEEDMVKGTDDWIQQSLLANFIGSIKLKKHFTLPVLRFPTIETLEVMAYLREANVEEGMVLLSEVEEHAVHFYTPDGDYLGPIISQDTDLLKELQRGIAVATVVEIIQEDESMFLRLQIQ